MVKFSFFTVRSKCCKKSKFVVLFLFFLSVGFEIFKFYIYCVYVFFLCLFLRCSLWLLLLPSINVFFSSSVERSLFSSVYVYLFSFSFLPVSCLSTRQPWPRTVSKNACANNPQQPTNRKKKDSQEKELPFSYSHLPSLSFILKRANARTQEERVCRDAPHLRADDRSTNRPRDSERIEERTPDEILTRLYVCLITLSWDPLSHFGAKIPCLSLITTSVYRMRGGRGEHFDSLIPKKHKTRQIATTTTTKERDIQVWERDDWSTMWEEEEDVEIRKHDSWLVFWWFFLDLERL